MNGEIKHPRVAEFFAGIGLVRTALEQESCQIVFANDFSERKRKLYGVNHDESEFICADIRDLGSDQIPDIDLATASFPCTDLSLVGNRKGINGTRSGAIWEFLRVLKEMGERIRSLGLLR